ncbi:MAG: hypothetical protein GTO45_13725 [Candidatus Aminicenantes bacterium]|nr:hypothetical protein [Candidatus Aminicenantes bacterium]NIN19165.1 hypothetical protein [Candidatus Aminicenantes bacterium]NIN43069.1 hypothetical protein [Candidatus Aminicenantes bacterium]NIN85810.1 hypothetical protein [Candidatus Aminicenantes bacterium]NIO82071.1 hypothetical protein [Candidatus Aminicenantes bacterium]
MKKKGKAVPFGQILDACGGKFRGLAELLLFSPKAPYLSYRTGTLKKLLPSVRIY